MNDMKQFNLAEYLKNPDRQVVTRDGHAARILCTDRNYDNYPVIALVSVHLRGGQLRDDSYCYTKDGLYLNHSETSKDLFFAPEKKEGWINIYNGITNEANTSRRIFNTKEEAVACANKGLIDTIKIEWKE